MAPDEKSEIRKKLRFLKNMLSLKCYGWNSEKYDTNMILSPLVDYFSKDEKLFKKMVTIRRGTGLMEIQFWFACLFCIIIFTFF